VVALFNALPEIRDLIRDNTLLFDTEEHRRQSLEAMRDFPHEKRATAILLKNFWTNPDNNYRDDRCKLIPTIVEGNWGVKMAVGQKPVILGRKVDQEYHRGRGYLEIDINLSSSVIATQILGMVTRPVEY
jgi:hypothetical protein